jgi:hypothetical protein
MKFLNIVLATSLAATLLAGCKTREERFEELDAAQKIVNESPTAVTVLMKECQGYARGWNPYRLKAFAEYMQVKRSEARKVFCDRVVTAIRDGRITAEDLVDGPPRKPLSPRLIRVIQGR